MKTVLLFVFATVAMGSVYAQSSSNPEPWGEYAVGGLYGYERNFGVRMVGLSQEVRVHANSYLDFTAGLTAVQAIQVGGDLDVGGYYDKIHDFTNYASILGEVNVLVSPFSPEGRFQLGLGWAYQYGTETYLTGYGYSYDQGEVAVYEKKYDRKIINKVGYVVSGSYRLWQTDHFVGRTNLKLYTYDRDFFAMIMSLGVQVGYQF
ncbi:MAG: hypothetical protein WA960_17490 [Tunicatimonas sp.]